MADKKEGAKKGGEHILLFIIDERFDSSLAKKIYAGCGVKWLRVSPLSTPSKR